VGKFPEGLEVCELGGGKKRKERGDLLNKGGFLRWLAIYSRWFIYLPGGKQSKKEEGDGGEKGRT